VSRQTLFLACVAATLASGCAPQAAAPPATAAKAVPSDLDRIGYEISACRGFCPAYKYTIAADGISFFEGERHTRSLGRSPVDGDPMLFRSLKQRLAGIRPAADLVLDHENCSAYSTDQQTVTVTWGWGAGETRTLAYDLGCRDPRYASIREALSESRRLMPIDALVGRATEY
jgi:hypothetical protein